MRSMPLRLNRSARMRMRVCARKRHGGHGCPSVGWQAPGGHPLCAPEEPAGLPHPLQPPTSDEHAARHVWVPAPRDAVPHRTCSVLRYGTVVHRQNVVHQLNHADGGVLDLQAGPEAGSNEAGRQAGRQAGWAGGCMRQCSAEGMSGSGARQGAGAGPSAASRGSAAARPGMAHAAVQTAAVYKYDGTAGTGPYLIGVQLHQVLGDEVMQLRRHLHARGPAPHNHKRQQLAPLLRRRAAQDGEGTHVGGNGGGWRAVRGQARPRGRQLPPCGVSVPATTATKRAPPPQLPHPTSTVEPLRPHPTSTTLRPHLGRCLRQRGAFEALADAQAQAGRVLDSLEEGGVLLDARDAKRVVHGAAARGAWAARCVCVGGGGGGGRSCVARGVRAGPAGWRCMAPGSQPSAAAAAAAAAAPQARTTTTGTHPTPSTR